MRPIKVSIPVKTYIRKYIEGIYPGTKKLDYRSTIGYLMYVMLEKRNSHWYQHKSIFFAYKLSQLNDQIIIELPPNENTFYKTGFEVPAAKAILINEVFEQRLIEEINFRCDIYNKAGLSRAKAIEDFCEDYNIIIDVDITYQAFKKAEYRYRVRNVKSKIKALRENL